MVERHRFRPSVSERLEARVALTHGGPIAPALIGTLSFNPRAGGPTARIVAQVNAAFNQFTADYLQAQGAYLSSGTAADATAFKSFTKQEVRLLSQQLTRTLRACPQHSYTSRIRIRGVCTVPLPASFSKRSSMTISRAHPTACRTHSTVTRWSQRRPQQVQPQLCIACRQAMRSRQPGSGSSMP